MKSPLLTETIEDGIRAWTFDQPGSSANVLGTMVFDAIERELDLLESKDVGATALLIRSAKPSIFLAGADLNELRQTRKRDLGILVERGQRIFDRLASLPFPTICLIDGACLGGGYELALACDYRIASNHNATKIGLPEIQLGLLPAWGGSSRLPRLVGVAKALRIILSAKAFSSRKALALGMIDAVVQSENLRLEADDWLALGKCRRVERMGWGHRLFGRLAAFAAKRDVRRKTRDNYPAPLRAIEVITKGAGEPMSKALVRERRAFVDLAASEASLNLTRAFFLQERSKKSTLGLGRPTVSFSHTQTALVVGAGIMGAGIAHWLASRGKRVLLRDVEPRFLAIGLTRIQKLFDEGVRRGIITSLEAKQGMDRITPCSGPVDPGSVDLAVEAVPENLEAKRMVLNELDPLLKEDALLVTNTSALSIDQLAKGLKRADRFVGLHFFNPVHQMGLVEVVRGKSTSIITLQRAVGLVREIDKSPVLAWDAPGFLVNRVLMPYLVEAVHLYESGENMRRLDEAMLDFGMPMGPMRLLDEVGLDVALSVSLDLSKRLDHFPAPSPILETMVMHERSGRKAGEGFYLYGKKGKPPCPSFFARQLRRPSAPRRTNAALADRMALVMVNEAARCLEEGIVASPKDIDFGMMRGTGWAPFRGGPLRFADQEGICQIVQRLEKISREEGPFYRPCELLLAMARKMKKFHWLKTSPRRSTRVHTKHALTK